MLYPNLDKNSQSFVKSSFQIYEPESNKSSMQWSVWIDQSILNPDYVLRAFEIHSCHIDQLIDPVAKERLIQHQIMIVLLLLRTPLCISQSHLMRIFAGIESRISIWFARWFIVFGFNHQAQIHSAQGSFQKDLEWAFGHSWL